MLCLRGLVHNRLNNIRFYEGDPLKMQRQSRVLDDLARILTNAAGAAQGIKQEIETLVRQQGERIIDDFDLVTRDEFEVLRSVAVKLSSENEELRKRVESLERKLAKKSVKKRVVK